MVVISTDDIRSPSPRQAKPTASPTTIIATPRPKSSRRICPEHRDGPQPCEAFRFSRSRGAAFGGPGRQVPRCQWHQHSPIPLPSSVSPRRIAAILCRRSSRVSSVSDTTNADLAIWHLPDIPRHIATAQESSGPEWPGPPIGVSAEIASSYCSRNTVAGSVREACQAGTPPATTATVVITAMAPASMTGSWGSSP